MTVPGNIARYFPNLSPQQRERLGALEKLYAAWNNSINVISRKDFPNFCTNHLLHSLAIAKAFTFISSDRVLDVGTGGGFPGIPLAIMFPETQFILIDSIAKKIRVVSGVADSLGLTNVEAVNGRAEKYTGGYNWVVTRAVAPLEQIVRWTAEGLRQASHPKGIIALKGGDLSSETEPYTRHIKVWSISDYFSEPYFETKKIVWLDI